MTKRNYISSLIIVAMLCSNKWLKRRGSAARLTTPLQRQRWSRPISPESDLFRRSIFQTLFSFPPSHHQIKIESFICRSDGCSVSFVGICVSLSLSLQLNLLTLWMKPFFLTVWLQNALTPTYFPCKSCSTSVVNAIKHFRKKYRFPPWLKRQKMTIL